jgi:CheY-like chemotaxis protein
LAALSKEPVVPRLTFQELVEHVRSALTHLYDYAFLQNHPLALYLDGNASFDGVTRAQRLRRLLLDCIEQLRPEGARGSEETRAYAILTYRCVDGLSMPEISDKLALSRRQTYREYTRGVDAVVSLVAEALHVPPDTRGEPSLPAAPTGERMVAAQEEVDRLKEALSIEPVDASAVVRSVLGLLAPRLTRTGVHFIIDETDVAPNCLADRAMLRQALVSLFSFALDVLPTGGDLRVCFANSGAEFCVQVRACSANSPNTLTLHPLHREGVGLAVAVKLIEAIGGSVEIREAAHEWVCQVNLPMVRNRTVLVIDDNADLTMLFQRFLAGHNVGVSSATSGRQAVERIHELRPALILLDLMLPHQDGWEILQQLRSAEQTATTPIIVCSVLNEPDLALAMGADDYITKPVSQETLVSALRRWLGTLHPAV